MVAVGRSWAGTPRAPCRDTVLSERLRFQSDAAFSRWLRRPRSWAAGTRRAHVLSQPTDVLIFFTLRRNEFTVDDPPFARLSHDPDDPDQLMSTYRLHRASLMGTPGLASRMAVSCEQCQDTLGIIAVEEEQAGLSAKDDSRYA